MTEDRFKILAEAYGGDVSRWPADERDAAAALVAANPSFAREVLADAAGLDAMLDDWTRTPGSAALIDRIVASAPSRAGQPLWRRWLAPAGLGAGLAAACVAGIVAGAQISERAVEGEAANVAAVIADLDPTTVAEEV